MDGKMEYLEKHYMVLLTKEEQQILKRKPLELLRTKPYPVLDILLLQSKFYFKDKIIETFEDLLQSNVKTGVTPNFLKFLIRLPADILKSLQQEKFREHLNQCVNNSKLNEQIYFTLIAHQEKHLLDDLLEYLKATKWQYFSNPFGSKEFILHYALNTSRHFLNVLLTEKRNFDDIADIGLRNNLIILKLVQDLSKSDLKLEQLNHIEKLLNSMDLESVEEEDLKTVYMYFYKHFKSFAILLDYIQKYPNALQNLTVADVLSLPSPLAAINKYKLLGTFEQAKLLIESYYVCQANSPLMAMKELELERLCHFFILSEIVDIITEYNHLTHEDSFSQKIQTVHNLLRLVKNFECLCKILDDILCLIYLRWEQMNKVSAEKGHTHFFKSSSSSPSYTDDDVIQEPSSKTKSIKSCVKPIKTGFICKSKSFFIIFNFLKTFVTKKLHSADFKQSTAETKQKFQQILDHIGDILWKYGFFEKLKEIQIQSQNSEIISDIGRSIINIINFHPESMEQESSEDEENQHSKHLSWQSRRKSLNKRRRATFSGSSFTENERKLVRTSTVLSTPKSFVESMTRTTLESNTVAQCLAEEEENRSIVPKLLTPPEKLAALTMSLKQFQETKQIIENFGLHNSHLLKDLEFIEQQKQVREKLETFYDNYLKQEREACNANKPLATVEQIRNVAAKGFEVSKIISYIDYFAQAHPIYQTETVKCLVRKHKSNPQYRFLSQFEEANLNAVIICDLILSLPFNRDITSSVLMIIKRHQAIQSTVPGQEGSERSQLPSNIGPLNFLENLDECMRILDDKSIKDLLIDNTYTLRADKMAQELLKEQIFKKVFYKTPSELRSCEDLKSLIPQFQAFNSKYSYYQKFCYYMQQLAKLVRLKDTNSTCHVDDLLKMDPYEVIGDLLFSSEVPPLEIHDIVSSLNLNLVHVISLNLCPEIAAKTSLRKRHPNDANKAILLNFISNHNRLLLLLLLGIEDVSHISKENAIFLERLVHMPEIEKLSSLYGGNKVIAALKSDHINTKLSQAETLDQLELMQFEIGIQEPKSLRSLKMDRLIIELIEASPSNIYLASKINDIVLKANVIHSNFTKIPTTKMAKELIEDTLRHKQAVQRIPQELQQKLKMILADIQIYATVSEVMEFETWPQAYDFGLKTPTTIFKTLLQRHLYKLCYEWCKVVKLSTNFQAQQQQILKILHEALIDMTDDENVATNHELNAYEYLLQILETFPPADCKNFLDSNKYSFRSLALLKYSIQYLERYNEVEVTNNLKNFKISISIFEQLTPSIRRLVWHLLRNPLLIIEQLVMNAKFEILTKVLASVRSQLALLTLEADNPCSFCFDKNGNVYDIHKRSPNSSHKAHFQLGANEASSTASAFILLNFNLYQPNHIITNDCIDFLLRIYATKALDYQISDTNSQSQPSSQSTNHSLDSLCGEFKMPSQAPVRSEWVRDEDATHCMCCRRAAFTMLIRRHHCRRCGRVVCYACSTHRMRIQELYEDVEVRVCNDCHNLSVDLNQRKSGGDSQAPQTEDIECSRIENLDERFKWKLSGIITHDKLVREEFCYEHAPSVALCLSILEYHLGKQKCVDLLLYHYRKLEKLIIPNPEVDFELVSKMMKCLALAAKVRGAPAEVETIQEHSDIIISLVQNGCENLIPPDIFGDVGLRKLADSLVQEERWDLAYEVHLKFGFPPAGVMVAHGLACLRAGCYDTAREKFNHCMTKLANEEINSTISKVILNPAIGPTTNDNDSIQSILDLTKDHEGLIIKRPQNGPPLLQEILKLIESLPFSKTQQETLQRASIIRNSNTSLVNLLSRRKEPYVKRLHEPSLNIRNTLENLERISKGQYTTSKGTSNDQPVQRREMFCNTRGFEECLHYVLTYGSHVDVVQFLMHHRNLVASLKYYLLQKLEADIFINHIYFEMLKSGKISLLIKHLLEFDSRLLIWQTTLLQTCRFLEAQNLLNSLYELQILLNDPVRAAMTCVKFYTMNCDNFQQQHLNAQHLLNAQMHLQTELENSPYGYVNLNAESSSKAQINRTSSNGAGNFQLQMDGRSLNAHINTIDYQLEVAKFLSRCEMENKTAEKLITAKVLKEIRFDPSKGLPTLFYRTTEKIQICLLLLLCGKNIEEGFGLAYRIIQHYKLSAMKVYAAATKYLALNQRISEVDKLINCITSNNGISTHDIDEILSVAVSSAVKPYHPEVKIILDSFVKKIQSIELCISSYIVIEQLKSAYLLANKYERLGDIRKILRKAEATNQIHIKNLCEKKLQMCAAHGK